MSIQQTMQRKALSRLALRCLTGNMEDLKGFRRLTDTSVSNPGLSAFLSGLARDVNNRDGMAVLFSRLGVRASRTCKKKLVENLIYNWGVMGSRRREQLAAEGTWTPSLLVMSPSMKCNLRCTGCYSGLYEKDGELGESQIDDVLRQAKNAGIYFIVISGGEPYLKKDMWLRLFREHNDMYFLTYTNGTLIDGRTARQLGRLGNGAPAISVEGFKEETDERRGKGVFNRVLDTMRLLRTEGVIFGTSVTYTRANTDIVTDDTFVRFFLSQGAMFSWYFMFMPVGKDPILELVPTPEQRLECGQRVAALRRRYPLFLADFWNDGPAAGGCLAGARAYMHILNSGRVEPCVFAHFGTDFIQDTRLLEVCNSPFFKAIRREFPYNENGNLMRPCMIIDNPHVLRNLVNTYLVPRGHEHSEDIVKEPAIIEWIDRYAERFRELTDPLWEKRIQDPEDRWYANGSEYRNLFRFKKQDHHGQAQKRRQHEPQEIASK